MNKVLISVIVGVANVYPHGQEGKAVVLREGEEGIAVEAKREDIAVKSDLIAPAAGVATGEPYSKRDGEIRVKCVEGAVTLRTYEGADFSDEVLRRGESQDVEVTESNRITLAVYELTAEPK